MPRTDAGPPPHDPFAFGYLFVNEGGRRIADDLNRLLSASAGSREPPLLWAGYLSVLGLLELLPGIQDLTHSGTGLRLLCGVSPDENPVLNIGLTDDPKLGSEVLCRLLRDHEARIVAEIDGIPVTRRRTAHLLELSDVLRRQGVECRREEKRTFHAKGASLLVGGRFITGSANLTRSGLRWNRELTGHLHVSGVHEAASLCEQWWDEATSFPLNDLVQRRLQPYLPEIVYLKILQSLYGDQVDFAEQPTLRPWQRDGVAHGLHILRQRGGVLLCDDVGIGKTDQALAMAVRLHRDFHCRTLVVCPAHLRTWWRSQIERTSELPADVVSYDRLARELDQADRGPSRSYGVIICDEAHRLRTPTTKRARALRELISDQRIRPQIILLTATPVNNSALDLYELLCLADSSIERRWAPIHPASELRGHRSGSGYLLLDLCQEPPPPNTPESERLRAALEERMVRRSRPQINAHYPESRSAFPTRRHHATTYELTRELRTLTGDVLDSLGAGALDSSETELIGLRGPRPRVSQLILAMYRVQDYELVPTSSGFPLAPLLRAMLLKRLESSSAAFAHTTERMSQRAELLLEHLDRGRVVLPGEHLQTFLTRAVEFDHLPDTDPDEDVPHDSPGGEVRKRLRTLPATGFDVDALRRDLLTDKMTLRDFARRARAAIPSDPKSQALAVLLKTVVEREQGAKILILSSSRRTAVDLYDKITRSALTDPRLAILCGRVATAAPSQPLTAKELTTVLAEFTPETMPLPSDGAHLVKAADRWDLVVGTDQISEGHNLQQAQILVNYDLPWNPQTLGHRMGRLDRYGALHEIITCYTVLPDTGLDLVLRLMDTLHHKIDIAASTVGVSSPLLPGLDPVSLTFDTALKHLGTEPRPAPVHAATERRIVLGRAVRAPAVREALDRLPPGVGAVHPQRDTGSALFCFRTSTSVSDGPLLCLVDEVGRCTLDVQRGIESARLDVDPDECARRLASRADLFDRATDAHPYHRRLLRLIQIAREHVIDHLQVGKVRDEDLELIAWMAC